jgi:hypothetical protein
MTNASPGAGLFAIGSPLKFPPPALVHHVRRN